MLFVSFVYPFMYGAGSQPSFTYFLARTLKMVQPMVLPMVLALSAPAVFLPQILRMRHQHTITPVEGKLLDIVVLASLWLLIDFAGIMAGGRGYDHYYVAAAASIGVLAGCGLHLLMNSIENMNYYSRSILVLVLASPMAASIGLQTIDLAYTLSDSGHSAKKHPGFAVGKTLRRVSRPSDKLFSWDYLPVVYDVSGLQNASRFTTAVNLQDTREGSQMFNELMHDLGRTPPSFVVMSTTFNSTGSKLAMRHNFEKWLNEYYTPLCSQERLIVFARRDIHDQRFRNNTALTSCSTLETEPG
jgi:hypothetical protein